MTKSFPWSPRHEMMKSVPLSPRHILWLLPLGILTAGCGSTLSHVATANVASIDGLGCRAYFAYENEPIEHVVLVLNGTGTGSNAFVHPSLEEFVRTRHILYVSLDRPGVAAPFGDPGAVRRDDAVLRVVTQGHVLACARAALATVDERFGGAPAIHLRGHSEGALISLYLYHQLLTSRPDLAARIQTLVLSGTPLQPFREIIEGQLDVLTAHGAPEIRGAVERCDWPVMRARLGISCEYLADAYERPSGAAMFEALAKVHAPAAFYLFHGVNDWNAPVDPVRALERSAIAAALDIHFTYYSGGHGGGAASAPQRARMRELLSTITR